MRNLIFVLVLAFTFFASCKGDDDFAPVDNGVELEEVIDIDNEDQEDEDNDDEDDQDNEDDANDNNDDDEDEDEDEEEQELSDCFLFESVLVGQDFKNVTLFDRNALGRLETITVKKNGSLTLKAKINYRSNGKLRAAVITRNSSESFVSFDIDGRPVDMRTTKSNGDETDTKYGLDDKGRIIRQIVRSKGETISERNYNYSNDNIASMTGFRVTSNGNKINVETFYKYDFIGLNPLAVDPYLAQIVLSSNVSKNLLTEIITGTGTQFKAEFQIDENLFPLYAKIETTADGKMEKEFVVKCL